MAQPDSSPDKAPAGKRLGLAPPPDLPCFEPLGVVVRALLLLLTVAGSVLVAGGLPVGERVTSAEGSRIYVPLALRQASIVSPTASLGSLTVDVPSGWKASSPSATELDLDVDDDTVPNPAVLAISAFENPAGLDVRAWWADQAAPTSVGDPEGLSTLGGQSALRVGGSAEAPFVAYYVAVGTTVYELIVKVVGDDATNTRTAQALESVRFAQSSGARLAGATRRAASERPAAADTPVPVTDDQWTQMVQRAERRVSAGVGYRLDVDRHDCFRRDCSGLVGYMFGLASGPATADLLTNRYTRAVSLADIKRGDLIVKPKTDGEAGHVTVFVEWKQGTTTYLGWEATGRNTLWADGTTHNGAGLREMCFPYGNVSTCTNAGLGAWQIRRVNTGLFQAGSVECADSATVVVGPGVANVSSSQSLTATFTLRNSGTSTWTRSTGYYLKTMRGREDFGVLARYELAHDVAPGQEHSWTIPLVAPVYGDAPPVVWRMARDYTVAGSSVTHTDTFSAPLYFDVRVSGAARTEFRVSGSVVDGASEAGAGLAGVLIDLGNGWTTTTDANGNFTLTGLPPTSFTVRPSKAEYQFSPAGIPVRLGPDASRLRFVASASASLPGATSTSTPTPTLTLTPTPNATPTPTRTRTPTPAATTVSVGSAWSGHWEGTHSGTASGSETFAGQASSCSVSVSGRVTMDLVSYSPNDINLRNVLAALGQCDYRYNVDFSWRSGASDGLTQPTPTSYTITASATTLDVVTYATYGCSSSQQQAQKRVTLTKTSATTAHGTMTHASMPGGCSHISGASVEFDVTRSS